MFLAIALATVRIIFELIVPFLPRKDKDILLN